jgi:cytidylate kinase
MIVSIGGVPGAGKTTLSQFLKKELGWNWYYMGSIFRNIANEKGITMNELHELAKTNPKIDHEIDEYQRKLGEEQDNFIMEGRTSFYFIPHSFKVYLDVDLHVAAERIFYDAQSNEKRNEKYATIEESFQELQQRMKLESEQYKRQYGFDNHDKSNYDLVINTTNTPVSVVEQIVLKEIRKRL